MTRVGLLPFDSARGAWQLPTSQSNGQPMKVGLQVEVYASAVLPSPMDEPLYVNLPARSSQKVVPELEISTSRIVDFADIGDPRLPSQTDDPLQSRHELLEPDSLVELDTLVQSNPGSLGHPEFCSRPCLYAHAGGCSNGAACVFCHLPHVRRAARLDRAHRQQLRNMPLPERIAAVLLALQEKLFVGGFATETLRPFQKALVEQYPHLAKLFEENADMPSHLKRLHGALMSHSVRMLIGIIKRAEFNPDMGDEVKSLTEEMSMLGSDF